jgi:hypothetical protein
MLNTYINDNHNVPYPFYGLDAMPFPNNYVLGLAIGVLKLEDTDSVYNIKLPLHVSTLTISSGTISLSICDDNDTLLCVANSNGSNTIYNSRLKYSDTDMIHVDIFTGDIPTDETSTYSGTFYIDPSCVTVTTRAVYGSIGQAIINKKTYKLEDNLSINFIEGINIIETKEGHKIAIAEELETENLTSSGTVTDSDMVDAINGLTIRTGDINKYAAMRINLRHELSNLVNKDTTMIDIDTELDAGMLAIGFHGTKYFPNCYDKNKDDA